MSIQLPTDKELAVIMAMAREGGVDLMRVLPDKRLHGALATLEADGFILKDGNADGRWVQRYRIAKDAEERSRFAMLFRRGEAQ